MKIKNTASNSGTSRLHDREVMDDSYEVTFDEEGGTVATVRQEVGSALAEKYPGIEVLNEADDQAVGEAIADDTDEPEEDDSDTNEVEEQSRS